MSLGFLTESALLPSKSKIIEVDGRSQLPLKAIVAEELSKREAAGGEGASEGLRKARGQKRAMEEGGKRDVYGGRNKGVEERNRRDAERDQLENPQQRHKRAEQILKRKAEDYERILRGEGELPDEDDEDNLVDFASKREQQGAAGAAAAGGGGEGKRAKQQQEEGKEKLPKGYAEMIDEFGRTRVVPKDSAEYKAFKAERDAQRQHEAFFGKKHRDRHAPPPPPSSYSSYHAAGEMASSYYGPASGEGEGQQGKWAWSRGDEEAAAREWAKREDKLRKRKEREAELLSGNDKGSAVQQGAVRTQWERRLESQAHEFLPQVISEEAASRQQQQQGAGDGGAGAADDAAAQVQRVKEERRQKLLARIQQQKTS